MSRPTIPTASPRITRWRHRVAWALVWAVLLAVSVSLSTVPEPEPVPQETTSP